MKKNRVLGLLLVMVLLCGLLSGCIGQYVEITMNEDGSGKVDMFIGFAEQFIEDMGLTIDEEGNYYKDVKVQWVYNGNTYWGDAESKSFKSLDEMDAILEDSGAEEGSKPDVNTGTINVVKESDGSFTLTLITNSETGNVDGVVTETETTMGRPMTEEELKAFRESMKMVYKFNFPQTVRQIEGPADGITISEKALTIDVLQLKVDKNYTYRFTTSAAPSGSPAVKSKFTDVSESIWYFEAVNKLAEGGLVNGVGNDLFVPDGTLTYAEFCQILAKGTGMETGAAYDGGYWASKAIMNCYSSDYVECLGSSEDSKVWSVPITREVAVRAIVRAYDINGKTPVGHYTENDIPDYESIDPEYRKEILDAYNYGICHGSDSSGTFHPKSYLTRAEICQLFYNIGWTTPQKEAL